MQNSTGLKICLILGLFLFSVIPAFSADLEVTVNQADQTLTISNTIGSDIYLLYLVNSGEYLHVDADLGANSEITIPYSGEAPSNVDSATCIPQSPDGIAGYEQGADGFYHLSVDLF